MKIDAKCILELIRSIQHIGDVCDELKKFKTECIDPFFSSRRAKMFFNWTIVLRLYFAANQRTSEVRQVCWREVFKTGDECSAFDGDENGNFEVMKTVSAFIERNKFEIGILKGIENQIVDSI